MKSFYYVHMWLISGYIATNGKQLHPENQQLPTSRLFINHSRTSGVALWSYHANLARGSTSHIVCDAELEDKDRMWRKGQRAVGRSDRGSMADFTSQAKVLFLPLNYTPQYMLLRYIPTYVLHVCNAPNACCCDIYQHTCYMCATLLIGYHAMFIQWLILLQKEASM